MTNVERSLVEACEAGLEDAGSSPASHNPWQRTHRPAAHPEMSSTSAMELLDALPNPTFLVAAGTGKVTFSNRSFRNRFGATKMHVTELGKHVHLGDVVRATAFWRNVADIAGQSEAEIRLHDRNGVYRWYWVTRTDVNPLGMGRSFLNTLVDIDAVVLARKEAERTSALFALAQQAAGAGVWDWDMRTDQVGLSAVNAHMHGLAVEPNGVGEVIHIDKAEWVACVWPEDLGAVWQGVDDAIQTGGTLSAEFRTKVPDVRGDPRWIQTLGRAVADEVTGMPTRFVGLHLDVTARRRADERLRASEARLRVSEERLSFALASGVDGLFDWDLTTGDVWCSEGWLGKFGPSGDPHKTNAAALVARVHPEDRARVDEAVNDHLDGRTGAIEVEYRRENNEGGYVWVSNRARVVQRDQGGKPLRLVGTVRDVTRGKVAEMQIVHMALHDALTELPNRTLFRRELDASLRSAAALRRNHVVLACDIDRFKNVNDTLGHPSGDRLLCEVGARLRRAVGPSHVVARLGGDEYAVLLKDLESTEAADRIAQAILSAVQEPVVLNGIPIHIGISLGLAPLIGGLSTAEDVFKRADSALYAAKAAGRGTYRWFDDRVVPLGVTRGYLALDMQNAIHRGEFSLVYQPIVDIDSYAVVSFEALMRWRHPEHGMISPLDFIPVAEETGLILQLGGLALQQACEEATRWPDEIRVSVNVSPLQLCGDLEAAVEAALIASGLPAWRLKLEVTESVLMQNPEHVLASLHRLRSRGIRIALDDFGTGYSSLSYLRRFPFDKLKIDRAFIREIVDPDAAAIVKAVTSIGERLGMGIVAEGVETAEQLELVRKEGCTEVQGYLFSRPLPAEETRAFVSKTPRGDKQTPVRRS